MRRCPACVLFVLVLAAPLLQAGDTLTGKVVEIRSADVFVLDTGKTTKVVRIVGIVTPKEGPLAARARDFVSSLILGKDVRLRFEWRNKQNEWLCRVFVDKDPGKEVALEMLRMGMARKSAGYDTKYGELAAAERAARTAKRGVWAQ